MRALFLPLALTCLLSTGLMAQRGGGARGGGGFSGGHGGFSGGHGGFVGGGFRGGFSGGGFRGGFNNFGFNRGGFGFNRGFVTGFGGGFGLGFYGGYWPSYYPSYDYAWGPSYYASDPYDYGYAYTAPPAYQPSPNVTVIYPSQAQQPQYERVVPMTHEYDEYGQEVGRPSNPTGSPIYLIAMKDHTIQAASSYRVEGRTVHYVTLQHEEKQVSLDSIDRELSSQLNRERRVDFQLPQ